MSPSPCACNSGGIEAEQGQLRGAAEAEGAVAEAGADVQARLAHVVEAVDVRLAAPQAHERRAGQLGLAAVGVAGQDEAPAQRRDATSDGRPGRLQRRHAPTRLAPRPAWRTAGRQDARRR